MRLRGCKYNLITSNHYGKMSFIAFCARLLVVVAPGQRLYLGDVWKRRELGRPAAALVLGPGVFVAGLFPLAGGGGPGLLAGGRCHLQHHHAAAGGRRQQPYTHTHTHTHIHVKINRCKHKL